MDPSSPVASSSSLSSSVLPLPQPGKSILKRAPPPQPRFFSISTLKQLLPTQPPPSSAVNASIKSTPLKRAHFILPSLQTVYTISTANPPCSDALKEEKRNVEQKEAERRKTIVRGNSFLRDKDAWWSMEKVESFYRECCQGREEPPLPQLSKVLLLTSTANQTRSLDLSGIQFTSHSASAFADILTVEWGLRKLVMKECNLEDLSLKPILHALLITNTLSFLSLASNRKLKTSAWRLLGVYIGQSRKLEFVDLSSNILDKKCMEYLIASLEASSTADTTGHTPKQPQSPTSASFSPTTTDGKTTTRMTPPPLVSLRLDDCSLRPGALDVLAHAVRPSTLRNLSIRQNRITVAGAVALALIIKDYPDTYPGGAPVNAGIVTPPGTPTSTLRRDIPSPLSPTGPGINGLPSPALQSAGAGTGSLLPPPRHPSTQPTSNTTYTPYVPRSKRATPTPTSVTFDKSQVSHAYSNINGRNANQNVPIITSSAQGGITTRHQGSALNGGPKGPSTALLDNIRALDNLPRLGALRTLDLRGNELRGGVSYIAQVLKRNRTLKVLNLSENKIDMTGLLSIAEALKYNSCLETLDLSRNPCCGPSLDGITSLRTAFTLNTSLKRLFLSATALTSAGAIALAEFLPESQSLFHLDLTQNPAVDMAGIVALNAGLKKNLVIRCLDLNIPPDNEELARLCREILNSCIRNTEAAEEGMKKGGASDLSGRGLGKGVWGMIEESVLAKSLKDKEGRESAHQTIQQSKSCLAKLQELTITEAEPPQLDDSAMQTVAQAKQAQVHLSGLIPSISDQTLMEELLTLNDSLTETIQAVVSRRDFPEVARTKSTTITIDTNVMDKPLHEEPEEDDRLGELVSPRVDKGKGRAEPEPEPIELVLSPSLSHHDDSDADDDDEALADEPTGPRILTMGGMTNAAGEDMVNGRVVLPSPIERSRAWVEEEAEIFRKGQVLLGPDEMEGDYDGEELRVELLEAEVERPPQRQLSNEELDLVDDLEPKTPLSPVQPPPSLLDLPRPRLSRSRSGSQDSVRSLGSIHSPS